MAQVLEMLQNRLDRMPQTAVGATSYFIPFARTSGESKDTHRRSLIEEVYSSLLSCTPILSMYLL